MDKYAWASRELHEHPAKHQRGVAGRIVRHASGRYSLLVGNTTMSVPQDFAARVEAKEQPLKDRVTITLDPGLLAKFDAMADAEHRSRSAMIEVVLRRVIDAALGK